MMSEKRDAILLVFRRMSIAEFSVYIVIRAEIIIRMAEGEADITCNSDVARIPANKIMTVYWLKGYEIEISGINPEIFTIKWGKSS